MAISVPYRKQIPYPFGRVLAQYFDLEHFETVHPKTLGQCRVLEVAGNRVLFEQRWPVWLGIRLRTTIEQVWVPLDQIRFHFLSGFLRGVAVATQLTDQGETTEIEETYRVPLVPAWSWLRPLVGWVVERGADGIWAEDLAVRPASVPRDRITHLGKADVQGDTPRRLRDNASCEGQMV